MEQIRVSRHRGWVRMPSRPRGRTCAVGDSPQIISEFRARALPQLRRVLRGSSVLLTAMTSPKLTDRGPERCISLASLANSTPHLSNDSNQDSFDNSVRDSLKSDRSKEDWRRRTIIIEKKNGSYGFTLQSYGIHYKKEKEIEMITYVDHVDPEGPAAAAGMREGDVIISINGIDVERSEHAAIVEAINTCDTRMRMVVIFEDCVRKVDLHLKYIKLQSTIQTKMKELEQVCLKEWQLLDNNWKTHSLPSQKKKSPPADTIVDSEEGGSRDNLQNAHYRPTLSSENVTSKPKHQPVSFMYQYLDVRHGTYVIQPDLSTRSFVITVGSPRSKKDCRHFSNKSTELHPRARKQTEHYIENGKQPEKTHRQGQSCTQCIAMYNNHDANSLDAYDLASPCCDPHCIPHAKKKHRKKKDCSKEPRKKEKQTQVDRSTFSQDRGSNCRNKKSCTSSHCSNRYRYLKTESPQTSQCSLHSYRNGASSGKQCDNSASSYTTSLSTETLFWDNDHSEATTSPKVQYQQANTQVKPKSWDNLTTKAFGGYGFGYGYLDTITKHVSRSKSQGRSLGSRDNHSHQVYHHPQDKHSHRPMVCARGHSHCAHPTKSTESLLVMPKYQTEVVGSETRLACDCGENSSRNYYRRSNSTKSQSESRSSGCYSHRYVYSTHSHKKEENLSSEITRL